MGIDFGMARIGIALSDETKFLASPYETYKRKNEQEDLNHIANLIKEKNVDEIICGLPYNMQGEEQEIAKKTNFNIHFPCGGSVLQLAILRGNPQVLQDIQFLSALYPN